MTRRKLATGDDIGTHLEWLRRAVQDPHVNTRVVLEGILDILEAFSETKGRQVDADAAH